MSKIIAISNQKGGVGKTTSTIALAHALTRMGNKVLVVELDPQCNASDTFKAVSEDVATVYDLMERAATADEAIQHTEICDIIPCDKILARADNRYLEQDRTFLVKEALEPIVDRYDYILCDCPPSLGVLLGNALTFAHYVIVPVLSGRYSLQGLSDLSETVQTTKKYVNSQLEILGIFMTSVQEKTNAAKDIEDVLPAIEEVLQTKAFDTKIRNTTQMKNAENSRQSIFEIAPYSTAARDYEKLAKEIVERLSK